MTQKNRALPRRVSSKARDATIKGESEGDALLSVAALSASLAVANMAAAKTGCLIAFVAEIKVAKTPMMPPAFLDLSFIQLIRASTQAVSPAATQAASVAVSHTALLGALPPANPAAQVVAQAATQAASLALSTDAASLAAAHAVRQPSLHEFLRASRKAVLRIAKLFALAATQALAAAQLVGQLASLAARPAAALALKATRSVAACQLG